MGSIIYPPEKFYSPSKIQKPNYDHIILWLLCNNDICKWADFRQAPIEIPTGTLSRHLEKLKGKGFVENFSRGHYKVTSKGRKQFNEISSARKKTRKINYPPEVILKGGRNYTHWILWMVYNNTYCKRSEFLEEPLNINQSSLSKNLGLLLEQGCIEKVEGKYVITRAGKSEYSRMLQNYDLDRQTVLEEESKRIEEITKKTVQFFEENNIEDEEIQYRFLNYILTLDYEKVKPILKEEETFRKIVLFLSINHPNQYPNFTSSTDFSETYKIKKTTLDYYIDEISGGKIYPLRFFKLRQPSGGEYYFQTEGVLEKMLRVITENKITKISYLNKLFSKPTQDLDINSIINDIANQSCEFLFNEDLKSSVREFLSDYIKYLAYNIEKKKELIETYDKLEGIIWQNITNIFQTQLYENLGNLYDEQIQEIDKQIESNPENLDLYYLKVRTLTYFNYYNDAVKLLDEMLELFPESEKDIKILKAAILRRKQDVKAGLEIIESLIEKYPEDNDLLSYKAYWLQFLDKKEEAIKIIQKVIKNEPESGIYHDIYGEILMYFEDYKEAAKKFVKSMVLGAHEWYIFQTYIKLGICYKTTGEHDLAVENLKRGIALTKKNVKDPETKEKWLSIANLFLSELKQ
ncbi:MAG: tetratricopeptide repeat protein [Promethearchaeota archaeon]